MYQLRHSYRGHAAGVTLYKPRVSDFGLARDAELLGLERHIAVTRDPSGGYPVFTVPESYLEDVSEEVRVKR